MSASMQGEMCRIAWSCLALAAGACAAGPDDGTSAQNVGSAGDASADVRCSPTRVDPRCAPADGGATSDAAVPSSDGAAPWVDASVPPADSGPTCADSTVDCGWPACNLTDGSDASACLAAGNIGGCPDDVFAAWCTRRVPGMDDRWMLIHERWVASSCGGTAVLSGNTYRCTNPATCVTYTCTTPLVIVFDARASVVFRPAGPHAARFDLSARGDGSAVRNDWPTSATPWLVLDRNDDGAITSGRELFGSATPAGKRIARDGFEALAALDQNGDGRVDRRDPVFARLRVWSDLDGDRVSTPRELATLEQVGIDSIPVRPDDAIANRCDARGNCEVERAAIRWRDARGAVHAGAIVDVHLH